MGVLDRPRFFTRAMERPAVFAWASSTYPTEPGVLFTNAATPSLPFAPTPTGKLGTLPAPTRSLNAAL